MISVDFIIFYKEEQCLNRCISCINDFEIPQGVSLDVLGVSEGESVSEAYDFAMNESEADYKVYVRENVYIVNRHFLSDMIAYMEANPDVAMAGPVGGEKQGRFIEWTKGKINIVNSVRADSFAKGEGTADYLLGELLVTRTDISWKTDREQWFDIRHCERLREEGFRLGVFPQSEPWCVWEYGAVGCERNDVFTSDTMESFAFLCEEEPLVSVIVPVHNGEEFTDRTIDSIMAQTYGNLEIILVDDHSGDNSLNVLRAYEAKDPRVKVIAMEKNMNMCYASNIAYKCSTGKYVALIGHDDVWNLTKISEQVAYLEKHDECSVCMTLCEVVNERMETPANSIAGLFLQKNRGRDKWIHDLVRYGNCLCAPSAVIRKEKIGEYLYKNGCLQLQDLFLWLKLLREGEIYILQEKITYYRQFDNRGNLNVSDDGAKTVRIIHELNRYTAEFLMNLPDEEYRRIFKDEFVCKESATKEELMCERALFLVSARALYGLDMLANMTEDPVMIELLSQKYHFELKDFYDLEKEYFH